MSLLNEVKINTEFSVNDFNNLHHFHNAKTYVDTDAVKKTISDVGQVIRKHYLEDAVGVCLLHKHFDLKPQEMLVESFEGAKSTVKCVDRKLMKNKAIPFTFKVNESGVWTPLEFVAESKLIEDRMKRVMGNQDFLLEVYQIIQKNGHSALLGLGVIHREHLTKEMGSALETTDDVNRVLSIVPDDGKARKGHERVKTMWTFRQGDDIVHGSQGCSHHLCSHVI